MDGFDITKLYDLGAMGIVLGYFIYRDITFLKKLETAFNNLAVIVAEMKGKVS